jgi:hypothetical protein
MTSDKKRGTHKNARGSKKTFDEKRCTTKNARGLKIPLIKKETHIKMQGAQKDLR